MAKIPLLLTGHSQDLTNPPEAKNWVLPGFFLWEGNHYQCKAYIHKCNCEALRFRIWIESWTKIEDPPESELTIQLTDNEKSILGEIRLTSVESNAEFGMPDSASYYIGKELNQGQLKYGPFEFNCCMDNGDVFDWYDGPLSMRVKSGEDLYFFYILDDGYFFSAYYAIKITEDEITKFLNDEIEYRKFLIRDQAYIFIFDNRFTFHLDGWCPSHVYYLEHPERLPDKLLPEPGIYFNRHR